MSIMETMERKKPRPRRSFTPEFKAEIVERCRGGDRSIGQVARDFDLTETAVQSLGRTRPRSTPVSETGSRPRSAQSWRGCAARTASCASRRRDAQASNSFLRQGDPVKVDPFIEAEEAAGHSVQAAPAACSRSPGPPSTSARGRCRRPARDRRRRAHRPRSRAVHAESQGTYGSPRVHRALR